MIVTNSILGEVHRWQIILWIHAGMVQVLYFGDSSDCPFLLVRLLNGSSCKILKRIGEVYEWVRCGEAHGQPILLTGQ